VCYFLTPELPAVLTLYEDCGKNIISVGAINFKENAPDLYIGSKGIGLKESEHFPWSSW